MHANDIAQFLPRWLMGGPGMTKSEPKGLAFCFLREAFAHQLTQTRSYSGGKYSLSEADGPR